MPCIEALRAMGEIQSLVAVLRRWRVQQSNIAALSGTSFFDNTPPPPSLQQKASEKNILQLISNLCKLREKLHSCTRMKDLDALLFVSPLIEVVKNPDTGATPTGVALAAIQRLVQSNVLNVNAPNVDHAIIALTDAIVNFKFEPTGTGADEITIMWVLEALLACLRCNAGRQLDDETVWKGIHTVFSVAVGSKYADMLRGLALRVLGDMCHVIMSNVYLNADDQQFPAKNSTTTESTKDDDDDDGVPDGQHYGKPVAHRILRFLVSKVNPGEVERSNSPTVANNWRLVCLQLLNSITERCMIPGASPGHDRLVLVEDPEVVHLLQDNLFLYLVQTAQTAGRGAGAPESSQPGNGSNGGNVSVAENATIGPSNLSLADRRKANVDQNLLAVCYALRLARLFVSCAQVRRELKLQVEILFNCVFLRVLEGKSASDTQAQVVMEVLTDLMADPLLIVDLYVNYDCNVRSTDVLENLFTYLSRHAFPARIQSPALDSLQLLSLRCIIYGIHAMSERCDLPTVQYEMNRLRLSDKNDKAALDTSELENLEVIRKRSEIEFLFPDETLKHKLAKRKLYQCAREFNRKPKYGIQALREAHVLHPEPHETDAERIASFLRHTHGLDRVAIGQFLGEAGELNKAVLKSFVHTFDLSGQSLLAGLRMFLESFRLPGEAQQIDRILEMFAEVSHAECYDAAKMPTVDCAYIFSFAIIMLNTDLHNPNIPPEKKMSFEAFVTNNRNYGEETSKGQDMPMELLETVYNEIKEREINTMTEGSAITSEITSERWADIISGAHAVPARGKLITHHFLGSRCIKLEEVPEADVSSTSVKESKKPGEKELSVTPLLHIAAYDSQILQLVWGPAVAAMSVVFDSGSANQQPGALKAALDGFIHCAKAAACYNLIHIFDSITVSLCKFTTLLLYAPASDGSLSDNEDPVSGKSDTKPAAGQEPSSKLTQGPKFAPKLGSLGNIQVAIERFNNNHKAQMATMCVFAITRRFGNHLRDGWGHVVYCMLRLCDLRLLPASLLRESLMNPSEERLSYHRAIKERTFAKVKERVLKEKSKHEQGSGWLSNWLFGGNAEASNAELLLASDPMFQHLSAALIVSEVSLGYGMNRFLSMASDENPSASSSTNGATSSSSNGDDSTHESSKEEVVDRNEQPKQQDKPARKKDESVSKPAQQQPKPARKKEEPNRFARDCIRSCRVHELVEESAMMNDAAVEGLVNALIAASGGRAMNSVQVSDGSYESILLADAQRSMLSEVGMLAKPSVAASVFSVHLLAQMCIRNAFRMGLFWERVSEHLKCLINDSSEPSFVVEGCTMGLLEMAHAALKVVPPPTSSKGAERLMIGKELNSPAKYAMGVMQYLVELPTSIAPKLSSVVGRYIAVAVQTDTLFKVGTSDKLVPCTGWETLFQFLTKASVIQDPTLFALNSKVCAQIIIKLSEQHKKVPLTLDDLPPPGFVYILSSYCRQPWRFKFTQLDSQEHKVEQAMLSEMRQFHSLLVGVLQAEHELRAKSEVEDVSPHELSAIRDYWLPVMLEFAGVAETSSLLNPDLACLATSMLEHSLLDQQGDVLSADEWRMVYEKILLPFAHNVLGVAKQLHDNLREQEKQQEQQRATPTKKSGLKLSLRRGSQAANNEKQPHVEKKPTSQEVQLSTLELAVVGLISKVTVARCESLLNIPSGGFDNLWSSIIVVFEQFKHRGIVESHGTGLLEGVTEHLKNVLLVACELGVIKDPQLADARGDREAEIRWDKTWEAVEPFCPGMRSTLFPDDLEANLDKEAEGEVKGAEVKVTE